MSFPQGDLWEILNSRSLNSPQQQYAISIVAACTLGVNGSSLRCQSAAVSILNPFWFSSMSDLPFTLDQLRILKAIAVEGSFKRAADSLYVSQPAVSLQVQNLERQLDVPLFDRGGRRAQLTEAGHLLLTYGEKILTLCQETCRAIEDLQNLQGGTLIVGASQTTGTYLLPRMIGIFRQQYPDVAVQLHVHSTRRTSWSVANGQVDLAIVGGEIPAELQESLKILPYAEDELALILPVNHELAQIGAVQKDDLYQLQFIALDSQSTIRKVIDQVLTRCGIDTRRLKVEMELNSIEAIKNAVQSGLGAAFVSVSAIEKELDMAVLYRAKVEEVVVKRLLSVIYNPNRYRSKAADAFIREILPQFATPDLTDPFVNTVLSETTPIEVSSPS